MEADNETVEPTRSLFGSPAPVNADVSEDSTVGTGTPDSEPVQVEEVETAEAVVEPTVEETVSDEPEQGSSEPQEAQPDVEVSDEVAQSEGVMGNDTAAVSTEVTEDTTLSAPDTTDAEPEKELPEIAKLKAEREKLDEAIHNKQLEERKSVMSQIAAVVKLYDIPLLELFKNLGGVPNPRKGEKAPITHKDSQGNTWTGRGRTPRWLKDKNPDDYRV